MGPGRPPLRGTKRGLLNLKLGHPPEPLASLPVLPSLSPDFQPPEPFPSISPLPHILARSCHQALLLPTQLEPDTLRQRGQSRCRTSGRFFLAGLTAYPGRHPHTLQSLSGLPARTTFCGCEPRVPTTLTAHPAPLLRTLPAANGACALPPPPSRVGAWSQEPTGRAVGSGGGGAWEELGEAGRGQAGWETEGRGPLPGYGRPKAWGTGLELSSLEICL